MTTSKLFTLSIRFTLYRVNMTAFVAHSAGVPRPKKQNLDVMFYGIVYQELAQLKEGPAIAKSPLFFRAWLLIYTLPNSRQIFQSDKLIFVLSLSYDTVTDSVIYPCLKALFLARQPFQQFSTSTPSATRAFRGFSLDIAILAGIVKRCRGSAFLCLPRPHGGNRAWGEPLQELHK